MRQLAKAIFAIVLLSSCAREVVGPAQQISGFYASDDGTGLTDLLLEFADGMLTTYTCAEGFPLAENQVWDDGKMHFTKSKSSRYSILDGTVSSDVLNGKISQDEYGNLTLGTAKYKRVAGFRKEPYSVIYLENGDSYEHSFSSGEYSFPVSVESPIPAGKLTAVSSSDWIQIISLMNGRLYYWISSTSTPRSGKISLIYTHAEAVQVSIQQTTSIAPTIELLNSIAIGKNDVYLLDYYTSQGTDCAIADIQFPSSYSGGDWQRLMGYYNNSTDKWCLGIYIGQIINPGTQYGSSGDLTLNWTSRKSGRMLWCWGNGFLDVYDTSGNWAKGTNVGSNSGATYNWTSGNRLQIGGLASSWRFSSYTFYGLRLYRNNLNGSPIAEYVPARCANETGLYNTVSKQFIPNSQN